MYYDKTILTRKKIWIIIAIVAVFTPAYLYYVKKDRAASIEKFAGQPEVGDIYKMRQATVRDGEYVYYLKVTGVETNNIHFIRSRVVLAIANDALLKQFDPSNTAVYTRKDILAIAAGKWKTSSSDDTELIEIERK